MGATYWLLPRLLGRELRWPMLARVQPYLWVLGMVFFSGSYHLAGLRGLPRRVYSASLAGEQGAAWHELTVVAAFGSAILMVSALAYLSVVVGTWTSGRRIAATAFEFAVPLHPEPQPTIWDRFGMWTAIAAALVAVAYAYPLYQLISHPRFGSPPFQPF
jgi:cytochrome c oxidase subunit 1